MGKPIIYKNATVKICTSCNNNKKLTVCSKKYKHNSTYIDCSICQKAVLYNSSILCNGCDHFVHRKCTNLTSEDIKNIENINIQVSEVKDFNTLLWNFWSLSKHHPTNITSKIS